MKNRINEKLQENVEKTASDIFVLNASNPSEVAETLFYYFYHSPRDLYRYENAVFDCAAPYRAKNSAKNAAKNSERLNDFNDLFLYKKRDFSETKEKTRLKLSKEKAFRFLLNEYIVKFKPLQINERKNLYLEITPQGRFIAVKKEDEKTINYCLSASEQTLFNFLCFIEINKFYQSVNGVKDFNYREKPLILLNFSELLDESFDYIAFLKKQNLHRKIILIQKSNVPKMPH